MNFYRASQTTALQDRLNHERLRSENLSEEVAVEIPRPIRTPENLFCRSEKKQSTFEVELFEAWRLP